MQRLNYVVMVCGENAFIYLMTRRMFFPHTAFMRLKSPVLIAACKQTICLKRILCTTEPLTRSGSFQRVGHFIGGFLMPRSIDGRVSTCRAWTRRNPRCSPVKTTCCCSGAISSQTNLRWFFFVSDLKSNGAVGFGGTWITLN